MAVTLNASTSTGLVQSADTSGVIELQSNGTTALTVNTNEGIQILNCLGVGGATPSTSGAGITFPASQSASSDANTLDDYEEGTFTPTIIGSSTAGTATYSTQVGAYRKIGSLVYITIQLEYTSGNGSGNLLISGLPFNNAYSAQIAIRADGITLSANSYPTAVVGSNVVNIQQAATGTPTIASVSYDGTGFLQVGGCYIT